MAHWFSSRPAGLRQASCYPVDPQASLRECGMPCIDSWGAEREEAQTPSHRWGKLRGRVSRPRAGSCVFLFCNQRTAQYRLTLALQWGWWWWWWWNRIQANSVSKWKQRVEELWVKVDAPGFKPGDYCFLPRSLSRKFNERSGGRDLL